MAEPGPEQEPGPGQGQGPGQSPSPSPGLGSDVKKCGVLRKWKSLHRRYCVLRSASDSGPARLELYDSEKKFRSRGAGPRRALPLSSCFTVNKRRDARSRYLLCVYTRSESVCLAAAGAEEQESWYRALSAQLGKSHVENGDANYTTVPGPPFKEVWQVNLRPRGLGHTRNMSGIYRLCLTDKTVNLVKLNSEAAAVVLQLMNIRRCGHSENFFFVEVGRSAVTGPGEFWMQVDDSVLAQNMHETILEAMKAMSEEFRLRSKSQSSGTNPISVPPRRHHPPPSRMGLVARRGAPTSPGQGPGSTRARNPGDGAASSRPPSADEAPCSPPPGQGTPGARPLPPPPPSRSTPDLASSPLGLPRGGFSSSSSLPSSSSDGEGYGSSPGSPGGGGGRPLHDYVAMGGLGQRQPQCQLRRRPSSRGGEDEEEEEADRGLSIRAWSGRLRPELPETGRGQGTDQGYVAMLPNVAAPSDDDYMAMTPKGPLAPHRVESPAGGYVLMSPSGSCSPDWARPPGGGSPGGDYMNMSPASTPPSCHQRCPARPHQEGCTPPDPRSPHCYHSLPRSYKQLDPALSASSERRAPPSPSAPSGRLILPSSSSPSARPVPSSAPTGRLTPSSSTSGYLAPSSSSLSARLIPSSAPSAHFAPSSSPSGYLAPSSFSSPSACLTPSSSPSGYLAPSSSPSACLAPPSSFSTGSSESLTEAESGKPLTHRQPAAPLDPVRASTLPRRRESSLATELQSPGEYVSIEFRDPQCSSRSPRGPWVSPSEYVNVGFGPRARPPPPLGPGRVGSPVPGDTACPPVASLPEGARDSARGLDRGVQGICAELQGRRRHCSETFPSAPCAPGPSEACSHHSGRRGSASLESTNGGDSAVGAPRPGMSRHMSVGFENGLNYIDLDLGTDSTCVDTPALQSRLHTPTGSLNTYASIDFHKSEGLRSHKSNKDDC